MQDSPSIDLIRQWQQGHNPAAKEVFDRYVDRLVGLARSKMSTKLQRRVEPEDIVQSAYRSFFRRAAQDQYTLENQGDLWRLLATITVNKVYHQQKHHSAKKRSMKQEDSLLSHPDQSHSPRLDPAEVEPTPDEALGLIEEVETLLSRLDPLHQKILELRLQGTDIESIAATVQRTERTIRRVLSVVESELQRRLGPD